MEQQVVGYKLVRISDGSEVQSWGGVWGVCPGVPNPLVLPNGDQVCGADVGVAYGEHELRTWVIVRELAAVKSEFARRVDDDAEAERLRYITPGAGMAMVYQEKFAQAQAVNAMGEAAAGAMSQAEREAQFPTLSASVGVEAASLWGCAQLVLAKYAAFAALSLVIERTRLTAKSQIAAATTVQGVRDAYEAMAWPTR